MKHNRLLNQFNYYKCIYKKIALFTFAFISIIDIYAKEGDRLITHTVNQADNIEQVAKKITLKGKIIDAKLLQKSEMRKDIVIELSYKGFG